MGTRDRFAGAGLTVECEHGTFENVQVRVNAGTAIVKTNGGDLLFEKTGVTAIALPRPRLRTVTFDDGQIWSVKGRGKGG